MTSSIKKRSLIVIILFICISTFFYWIVSQFFATTDDTYVNANVVHIATRVSGQIKHLNVMNNQYVKAGDLLFELDASTFEAIRDQAQAQYDISIANLKLAESTDARTLSLVKKRVASAQEGDNVKASLQAAFGNLQLAKANLRQANLNLAFTQVIAPTSGWITNSSLQEGDIVTANQPLFALISDQEYWVDANFKETDILQIHPGQHAKIKIDMYPKHNFEGIVQSISGGTGNAFSLLPPENATGNWVKVTQRIPVRIRILNPDPRFPLRIGSSANVSIRISPWSH